jgi:hypothetical protein
MKVFKAFASDLIALLGFSLVCYGLYSIYEPAAFIVGGAFLCWLSIPKKKDGK